MRTPVMAGNWKMYKTAADTRAYFEKFLPLVKQRAKGAKWCSARRSPTWKPPWPKLAASVVQHRRPEPVLG